jgi:hypothetical protein
VTVQVPGAEPLPAGIERGTFSVTLFAVIDTAPAPLQVLAAFGTAAIVTPAGKVSVSAAERLAADVLALVSVIVRVDVPPAAIGLGEKPFASVGAAVFTVRLALAAAALLPWLVCSAPAAMVLV